MKKALLCLSAFVFLCFAMTAHAVAKPTKVEVLYMNHGPLEETVKQIRGVLAKYGEKLTVSWYDFDTPEGEQFMAKKGVRQHIPLVIWIDDSPVVNINVKKVQFVGFPTGAGPAFFQGKWTMNDLRAALDWVTGNK
ncbi:MAG: hypothetical protein AB1512_14300 [Thermodesulfobacteriota bacterium]